MTADEKLTAILAAVQTDPGNRGLARDPADNLFTATAGDFQAACRSLADHPEPALDLDTGFYIPTADPPAFETDGPLGALFLMRLPADLLRRVAVWVPAGCAAAIQAGVRAAGEVGFRSDIDSGNTGGPLAVVGLADRPAVRASHKLALECVGPAADGRRYSMRGRDVSGYSFLGKQQYWHGCGPLLPPTIGIGDGGNEIGMGKVPHETVVRNIPNGDLIHCRVATDYLIVAGVSNWGAYALAAGVLVLRGVKPPPDLFDHDRERAILEVMVRDGPLVDGVTGRQEATVDGLTWDEYTKPLVRIRDILEG